MNVFILLIILLILILIIKIIYEYNTPCKIEEGFDTINNTELNATDGEYEYEYEYSEEIEYVDNSNENVDMSNTVIDNTQAQNIQEPEPFVEPQPIVEPVVEPDQQPVQQPIQQPEPVPVSEPEMNETYNYEKGSCDNVEPDITDRVFDVPNTNCSFDTYNDDNLLYESYKLTDNYKKLYCKENSVNDYESCMKKPGLETNEYKMYEGVNGVNPLCKTYADTKSEDEIINKDAFKMIREYLSKKPQYGDKIKKMICSDKNYNIDNNNGNFYIPKSQIQKCRHKETDTSDVCKKKSQYIETVNERNRQDYYNMNMGYGVTKCFDVPQIKPPACIPQKKSNVCPTQMYSMNQGTPLELAKDTMVGSILPKFQYREIYDSKCY